MEYTDYYKVLGLTRKASQDEIKKNYRNLARKYHPDTNKTPGAEDRFKGINEAHEVLKDPQKRAAYDQLGANWKGGQEFRRPQNWENAFDFGEGGFPSGGSGGFSDFFETLFGQAKGRGHRSPVDQKGADQTIDLKINIEDAYHGTTQILNLRKTKRGVDGRNLPEENRLSVKIPKGLEQGHKVRLAGQGGSGIGNGSPGDLFLKIEFRPHPFYRVEGKDVYLDFPVTPWELVLGASLEVPTPEGPVKLKIPPHSKQGQKLRLHGRGIPSKVKGDLYVILNIALPPAKTDASKAAYEQMAQDLPFNPREHFGL